MNQHCVLYLQCEAGVDPVQTKADSRILDHPIVLGRFWPWAEFPFLLGVEVPPGSDVVLEGLGRG